MTLVDLKPGQTGKIINVRMKDENSNRLLEVGFVIGQNVTFVRKAPMGDPLHVSIMGYQLCIRGVDAQLIDVELNRENNS